MPNYDLRRRVWNGLVNCDYTHRYHCYLADRLVKQNRLLLWGATVFSSGAAISFLGRFDGAIGSMVALAAAILSGWALTGNYSRKAEVAAQVSSAVAPLLDRWADLWSRVDTDPAGDIKAELQRLDRKTSQATARARFDLPILDSVRKRASQEAHNHWLSTEKAAA